MKKMMGYLFTALAMCLLFVCTAPQVFANPCCWFEIESVTQADDGIKVEYWAITSKAQRQCTINLSSKNQNGSRVVYTDEFYVTNDETSVYTIPVDDLSLIDGFTYTVSISSMDCCDNAYCETWYESKDITVSGGVPHFTVVAPSTMDLTPVGEGVAAVTVTIPKDGFYKCTATDSLVRCYFYNNNSVSDGLVYYNAGKEITVLCKSVNGENELKGSFVCEEAVPEKLNVKVNPAFGDPIFSISDRRGLSSFEIKNDGVYRFSFSDDNVHGSFKVYDSKGNMYFVAYKNGAEELFYSGTYYIDTTELDVSMTDGKYTLTAIYAELEELNLNTEYSLSANTNKYYVLNVTEPSCVKLSTDSARTMVHYDKDNTDILGTSYSAAPAGRHYINVVTYDEPVAGFSVDAESVDTMELDTATQPSKSYTDNYGRTYRYIAFKAPTDGKYEFDFTQSDSYKIVGGAYRERTDYYLRDMKKDEWVLFRMGEQDAVSVKKYVETVTALNYDEKKTYQNYSGRCNIFSFTPPEDGAYKFFGKIF